MFKSFIESASQAISSQKDAVLGLIDAHRDTVESTLTSVLIRIAEDHLTDEKHTTALFETAHAMLPLPLRLGIRQGTFIEYCHANKESLLQKVQAHKALQQSTKESPLLIEKPA